MPDEPAEVPEGAAVFPAIPPELMVDPLLLAVQKMIERRQATVRPCETPYQVRIRFQVRPDGMQSYRQAYPALESLRIPMASEFLEMEP